MIVKMQLRDFKKPCDQHRNTEISPGYSDVKQKPIKQRWVSSCFLKASTGTAFSLHAFTWFQFHSVINQPALTVSGLVAALW